MKVVINACFGGFRLSEAAENEFRARSGYSDSMYEVDRSHPDLVAIVEENGKSANTRYSELKVVEIPDGVEWTVKEYDGQEWIAEKHRTWY